ncbi:MAG: type II secretion system GspH family protein [Oscillospiraceae bacterium]|nr:type II secretion system GspH family protein [Oscillospiraceae bacterium]
MNLRKNKGITLIALIITVIVMLILATVAIGSINSGLFDKAKQATEDYNNSVNNENDQINNAIGWFEGTNGDGTNASNTDGSWNGIINTPKLTNDMKAVYWAKDDSGDIDTLNPANNTTEIIQGDNSNFKIENWYNYTDTSQNGTNTSRWANAITADGSYWVWIPRYEYKIDYTGVVQGVDTDYRKAGNIDVRFIDISTKSGSSGYTTDSSGITRDNDGYIIHPAFTNNVNQGGWDSEISGFWVAKFEMSGETNGSPSAPGDVVTSSTIKAVSKPGVSSWGNITIGNCYTNSLNYDTTKYSHLIKNSEWGAVAYLTHSQWGRNGTELTINVNISYITGGGTGTAYATANTAQSTTGNPTGVYDMSGGAGEYVAAFNKAYSGTYFTSYGSSFASTGGSSTKYATAYSNSTNTSYATTLADFTNIGGVAIDVSHIGDGIHEVWVSDDCGWFSDSSLFVSSSHPFFIRGGYFGEGQYTGVFCADVTYGGTDGGSSFRIVLVP